VVPRATYLAPFGPRRPTGPLATMEDGDGNGIGIGIGIGIGVEVGNGEFGIELRLEVTISRWLSGSVADWTMKFGSICCLFCADCVPLIESLWHLMGEFVI